MKKSEGYLLSGLTRKNPSSSQLGVKMPTKSVDEGATRDSQTAPTPSTLGPRTA